MAWKRFLGVLVSRYGPRGSFWIGRKKLAIRHWQIWNEPNFRLFWAPRIEPAGYAKLLRASATTIRTADSGAKIVLAGIASVGAGMKAWVFMRRLLRVPGVRGDFDYAALDTYSANVPELGYQLEKVRAAMVAGGAGRKPLIVTEVGVASWGSYPSAFVEGEDGQIARTALPLREEAGSGAIVVRRLLPTGQLDTSFGADGAVRLPCPCAGQNIQLLAGPKDSTFVVSTSTTRKKTKGEKNGVTAGDADQARRDRPPCPWVRPARLGERAGARRRGIEYDAITPGGVTYFGGRGLTKPTNAGFLLRISKTGRLDTDFRRRAIKSLKRLNAIKGNEVRVTAAVIGTGKPIELFGNAGSIGGFELRLNPNGTPKRGWAEKGLALLPYPISAAVQGREGSTIALSGGEAAAPHVLRILGKGKLDPAFGKTGQSLPGATNESGYALFPAGLGRFGVSDLGLRECRQACEASAKLYRFLEGR